MSAERDDNQADTLGVPPPGRLMVTATTTVIAERLVFNTGRLVIGFFRVLECKPLEGGSGSLLHGSLPSVLLVHAG